MENVDPGSYGDRFADVYDEWYSGRLETIECVDFLKAIGGRGPALELGIGTGRVALALAERGINVVGVEGSAQMVERMKAKAGGDAIRVIIGDLADVPVEGTFPLIYIPFSSLFLLPSQAEQIRCFQNVAEHLAPRGSFVIDAFVPDVKRYDNHQNVSFEDGDSTSVRIDVARHDPVEQRITSWRVVFAESGTRVYPYWLRYAYAPELDAMAMCAGLRLVGRYGGYDKRPYDADSRQHVSVYATA